MPFVRFSRDKRGYEHVYLVHQASGRGQGGRPRVLYWFRTPPGVKVGRSPFDPATQRAIESRNPGVIFDWAQIVAAKMPPPVPVEGWRERRRAERAAKRARVVDVAGSGDTAQLGSDTGATEVAAASDVSAMGVAATSDTFSTGGAEASEPTATPVAGESNGTATGFAAGAEGGTGRRRRRRRRGGRHRSAAQDPEAMSTTVDAPATHDDELDPPAGDVGPSNEE